MERARLVIRYSHGDLAFLNAGRRRGRADNYWLFKDMDGYA